jgi:hypothetical protein
MITYRPSEYNTQSPNKFFTCTAMNSNVYLIIHLPTKAGGR